jgi:hypothetical protein
VEDFQILEDLVSQLDTSVPLLSVEEFGLQFGPEGLHHGVVERVTDREGYSKPLKQPR